MSASTKKKEAYDRWYNKNRDRALESKRKRYKERGGREKSRERARERRKADPDQVLFDYRKWRYGITREEFGAMFEAQGRRCAICPKTDPGFRGWCVDHDHKTNKVRGILCRKCNLMLGYAEDQPETLASAIDYLKGNQS